MYNNSPGSRFLAALLTAALAVGGVPAPTLAQASEIEVIESDADERLVETEPEVVEPEDLGALSDSVEIVEPSAE